MDKLLAFTKPTKEYHHTFLCRCETNLFIPEVKAGQIIWCLRCGQHWEHDGKVSLKQVEAPNDPIRRKTPRRHPK